MRQAIKRSGCGLLILCMIFVLYSTQAMGSVVSTTTPQLHVENSSMEDGQLKIYTNNNLDKTVTTLGTDNFSITLRDVELPCTKAVYFSDANEPVTYIFLVDVSGSIDSKKLGQMKDYLKLVAGNLGAQDKVCLITLGNTIAVGDFVSGRESIEAQIDGIQGLYDDTNLYYGIAESLKILNSDTYSTGKRALLVLSDGEDEQATGITREEVNKLLEETRIPVYTAAILGNKPSAQQQEFAKILGSFARLSAGGIHTAFGVEDISMEDSASRMAASISDSMVLYADVSGYETGTGQAYLQVTVKDEAQGTASDGYMISEKDLSAAAGAVAAQQDAGDDKAADGSGSEGAGGRSSEGADGQEPGVAEASGISETSEMSENAAGEEENVLSRTMAGLPLWAWLAIAAALLLIVIIIIAVSVSRKKRRAKAQREAERLEQSRMAEAPESGTTEILPEDIMEDDAGTGDDAADNAKDSKTGAVADDADNADNAGIKPAGKDDSGEDADESGTGEDADGVASAAGLDEEGTDGQESAENTAGVDAVNTDSSGESVPVDTAGFAGGMNNIPPPMPQGVVVYLTKIGLSEEKTYKIVIRGEVTLGRQPQRADYAFPEDGHMSGVHCALTYFDDHVILWDKGSMNGTQVNGIPITAPYALRCDDIIHIGNTEFRIHW